MRKNKVNKRVKTFMKVLALMLILGLSWNVSAEEQKTEEEASGSMLTITGEAQIYPINDGTEQYILKSDGFYCLTSNGQVDTAPGVHYFDHMDINGTVFNGYYYHDENGKFRAGNERLIQIQQITCNKIVFDGYYMVGNLGKMTAASQVRYLENVTVGEVCFQGYYYFDVNGRLTVEPNVAEIHMTVNDKVFNGKYYFGGEMGVLVETGGITEDGFVIGADGKVAEAETLGVEKLQPQLETVLETFEGDWSVYVKDLETGETFSINNQSMYSASLIKPFVMAKTYQDMETVVSNELAVMKNGTEQEAAVEELNDLLQDMIIVSDNESYNELVRLQTDTHDFVEGANITNTYLEQEGYKATRVQHTLHPSDSEQVGIAEDVKNMTSVEDCGLLLEKIVRGLCVSEEASQQMLMYMKEQDNTSKIPAGLPENVVTANKTGETDHSQHDMAIIYGDKATYILCVMSENWSDSDQAVEDIKEISKITYAYLNY